MTAPTPDARPTGDDVLAAAGIVVTVEGKARARERRLAAEARWTPERWNALRAQLGLPPRTA